MRRFCLILAALSVSVPCLFAGDRGDLEELWDKANTLYINGDYEGAILLYDSIMGEDYVSPKLYYNLGNAHFKANHIGKAVVNYNKALRLSPSDKDIAYNLSVANSYVKDRIDVVPEFIVTGWVKRLKTSLHSNVWAVISLILLAAALGFVLLYMLSEKKALRKTGFFTAIVFAVLFAVTVSFSVSEKRKLTNASEAVVVASAVAVKSSPNRSSTDLFIIHEGTKVEIMTVYEGWTEIMIADGNKGWLLNEALELID